MLLSKLLCGFEYEVISNSADVRINKINYDSRKIQNEDVFVCIDGFSTDGHKFAQNAIKNGAKALIIQKDIDNIPEDIVLLKVKDTRKALAHMANVYYNYSSKKFNLIGVTGTNGKTTTTYMIEEVLKTLGQKVGVIGTISNKIGDRILHTERTTPESLELQEVFREMADEDVQSVAMEVSSHALDLDRVYGCEFCVGIFTNLTRDHLDFHKTFEAYAKAKAKLFGISKKAVINIDSKYSKYMLEAATGEIITFGINKNADISASNIQIDAKGTRYYLKTPFGEGNISLNIPGIFTVYNSLGSIAACLALGISFNDVKKGIENIKGVPGRFELVETDTAYSVIVDYAHTPDGLENILNTAKEFAKGKIITIFGCGGDRDKTKRPLMGEITARLSDYCIVTSDNPRSEDPEAILNDIMPGVLKIGTPYKKIVDRKESIKAALEMAEANDIIIIAGKGHENYQILKDKTIHFDDKEIVKELLN